MTYTIEQIKKMLSEITQGRWKVDEGGQTVSAGKRKQIISALDDMNPEITIYESNEKQSTLNLEFISSAPTIIKELVESEELVGDKNICSKCGGLRRCEQRPESTLGSICYWETILGSQLKELELKFQAAKESFPSSS